MCVCVCSDNEAIQRAITEYDNALEAYIPVLMAMASMHWDMENYEEVERIFRQSAEFCSEHEVWKLNVAHCFFMQDDKFTESIRYVRMRGRGVMQTHERARARWREGAIDPSSHPPFLLRHLFVAAPPRLSKPILRITCLCLI